MKVVLHDPIAEVGKYPPGRSYYRSPGVDTLQRECNNQHFVPFFGTRPIRFNANYPQRLDTTQLQFNRYIKACGLVTILSSNAY